MDRAEIRNWYKLLEQQVGDNKNNLIEFMTDVYGEQSGELMKQIIKEENLIQIDNMNRKLAEIENNIDSDEVFYSKTTIEKFEISEADEIWK